MEQKDEFMVFHLYVSFGFYVEQVVEDSTEFIVQNMKRRQYNDKWECLTMLATII